MLGLLVYCLVVVVMFGYSGFVGFCYCVRLCVSSIGWVVVVVLGVGWLYGWFVFVGVVGSWVWW